MAKLAFVLSLKLTTLEIMRLPRKPCFGFGVSDFNSSWGEVDALEPPNPKGLSDERP